MNERKDIRGFVDLCGHGVLHQGVRSSRGGIIHPDIHYRKQVMECIQEWQDAYRIVKYDKFIDRVIKELIGKEGILFWFELNDDANKEKVIGSIQTLDLEFCEIKIVKKIPRDKRHNSKIDYAQLNMLLTGKSDSLIN